ncbi:hypothetical protein MCUN1_001912 [Malassezia cuniculi]|uniref:Cation-transporting ATPase n=1 Tax=Malassezia cuniculi TaxID=948313 RepID=A0AAF0ETX8_9BASI|nr:hypothetical protein MCUN1_001912 [Malassezia cuniculi]
MGRGRSAAQPFELADEQYQAPFALGNAREQEPNGEAEFTPSSVSSSFFGDEELKAAQEWARESQRSSASPAGIPQRRRRRRDSQVGSYEDANSVFDGPAAEFVPSSVSSMHHVMSRPSFSEYSERRRRQRTHMRSDSRSGRASQASFGHSSRDVSPHSERGSSRPASIISYRKRNYGSTSRRTQGELSTSIIGSLLSSRRDEPEEVFSDEEFGEGSEQWSDNDDDQQSRHSSESDRSSTSSMRPRSPTGRMIPLFGEFGEGFDAHQFHDGDEDAHDAPFHDPSLADKPFHLKDYPDAAPLLEDHVGLDDDAKPSVWLDRTSRSKQQVYLADEDTLIHVIGYRTRYTRMLLYMVACVVSLGIVPLVFRWLPRLKLRHLYQEVDFVEAEFVVVENQWGDMSIEQFSKMPFARPMSVVFPPSLTEPPSTHAQTYNPPDEEPETSDELIDPVLFTYRYMRFILHPPSGRFRMLKDWRDAAWKDIGALGSGTTTDSHRDRWALFGPNQIDIVAKSTWALLVDEVLHPFYMFQIVSIFLWMIDDYYYYAFCIAAISVGSIVSTLIETHRTVTRMREMNRFVCTVRTLRNGEWIEIDSSELVPGDVFDAADPSLTVVPADSVLLSGDAIMNESMLTGESVPISKVPLTPPDVGLLQVAKTDMSTSLARHFLFAGTKVIRIRAAATNSATDEVCAKALVVGTGFNTTKGALVRSMLFPKPMGFKFYRDSFRFIGFLACIAGVGFLGNTVNFIELGISWNTLLIRVLDLITVVVPPALPATMSIGTAFAIVRLRNKGVFCTSPMRVNIGGKVNVACFDKTGTLTEDGLDVLGVRTVDPTSQFSELHTTAEEIPEVDGSLALINALSACHSLKVVDGEVIGDPLDIKMFEFTNWTLDEGDHDHNAGRAGATDAPALVQTIVRPPGSACGIESDAGLELGVIRQFEFVSALRRMSVIVKRLHSESMEIFVKGAPEALIDICDVESLPADYDDLLSYYTKHGYRVIACAGKSIPGMTWVEAQRITRTEAESNLQFLGLIVFENKLKPGTAPAIETLRNAHIVCKMVTGDNPRTAISVARECGMVSQSTSMYLPSFEQGSPDEPENVVLRWTNTDDDDMRLNPDTLKPIETVHDQSEMEPRDYALVVSGDVFRWMMDYAPIEIVRRMLIKGTIFARMSPDEKHELIDKLQELGYTVGMCGDGANDCGALKAADMGISLSEAEASVAAPFTSTRPDISCVIEVLREGRAALVTSFSCFKYMALYSLIQFTSISLLYSLASSLGDFQFLYIDLFIILPVAVAMARTLPYPTLSPKRPTANLMSKKVLISMIGQVVICAVAQGVTFWLVRHQEWYKRPEINPDKLNVINYENTTLFLVSSFQYITVAAVFSVGPPYRLPIYTNPMLLVSLMSLGLVSLYVLFVQSGYLFDLFGLVTLPMSFHWTLFTIVAVNTAMCFVFESYLSGPTLRVVKALLRVIHPSRKHDKHRKHDSKAYKAIISSLNDPDDA